MVLTKKAENEKASLLFKDDEKVYDPSFCNHGVMSPGTKRA